jgi:hypothetical protein
MERKTLTRREFLILSGGAAGAALAGCAPQVARETPVVVKEIPVAVPAVEPTAVPVVETVIEAPVTAREISPLYNSVTFSRFLGNGGPVEPFAFLPSENQRICLSVLPDPPLAEGDDLSVFFADFVHGTQLLCEEVKWDRQGDLATIDLAKNGFEFSLPPGDYKAHIISGEKELVVGTGCFSVPEAGAFWFSDDPNRWQNDERTAEVVGLAQSLEEDGYQLGSLVLAGEKSCVVPTYSRELGHWTYLYNQLPRLSDLEQLGMPQSGLDELRQMGTDETDNNFPLGISLVGQDRLGQETEPGLAVFTEDRFKAFYRKDTIVVSDENGDLEEMPYDLSAWTDSGVGKRGLAAPVEQEVSNFKVPEGNPMDEAEQAMVEHRRILNETLQKYLTGSALRDVVVGPGVAFVGTTLMEKIITGILAGQVSSFGSNAMLITLGTAYAAFSVADVCNKTVAEVKKEHPLPFTRYKGTKVQTSEDMELRIDWDRVKAPPKFRMARPWEIVLGTPDQQINWRYELTNLNDDERIGISGFFLGMEQDILAHPDHPDFKVIINGKGREQWQGKHPLLSESGLGILLKGESGVADSHIWLNKRNSLTMNFRTKDPWIERKGTQAGECTAVVRASNRDYGTDTGKWSEFNTIGATSYQTRWP